jgi:hypothetical protein
MSEWEDWQYAHWSLEQLTAAVLMVKAGVISAEDLSTPRLAEWAALSVELIRPPIILTEDEARVTLTVAQRLQSQSADPALVRAGLIASLLYLALDLVRDEFGWPSAGARCRTLVEKLNALEGGAPPSLVSPEERDVILSAAERLSRIRCLPVQAAGALLWVAGHTDAGFLDASGARQALRVVVNNLQTVAVPLDDQRIRMILQRAAAEQREKLRWVIGEHVQRVRADLDRRKRNALWSRVVRFVRRSERTPAA